MSKKVVVLVGVLLAIAAAAQADIGEDFEPGGVALLGSGSYYMDLGPVLDPTSQYTSGRLSVSPEVDFFFLRDTAIFVDPYLTYSSTQNDTSNIDRVLYYGASAGAVRYFVSNPRAQSGLVPSVGAAVGFELDPGVGDRISGYEATDNSLFTYAEANLILRANYFFNDRLAAYVSIVPRVWYTLTGTDASGATVTLQADQRFSADIGVYFGVGFWIPRSKESF